MMMMMIIDDYDVASVSNYVVSNYMVSKGSNYMVS